MMQWVGVSSIGYMMPCNWFNSFTFKKSPLMFYRHRNVVDCIWTSNVVSDLYGSQRSDSSSDHLLRWIEEEFSGIGLELLYRLAWSLLCIFLISFMELKSEIAFLVPSIRSTWNVKPDLWIKKLTLDHNSVERRRNENARNDLEPILSVVATRTTIKGVCSFLSQSPSSLHPCPQLSFDVHQLHKYCTYS